MTSSPLLDRIRVVLLDVEGTTTPIAFVRETLFPFARAHLADWLRRHARSPVGHDVLVRLAQERRAEASPDEVPPWGEADEVDGARRYADWLMDRDRKSPALKMLQGLIWEEGYQAGLLRGDVFPDVPPAIERIVDAGRRVAIYSSGSTLAQRRLFESVPSGGLTDRLSGFFDTGVGPKTAAQSYQAIARSLGVTPDEILFVSDAPAELDAARAAGCRVALSVRAGNAPVPPGADWPVLTSFADLH